jgi:hypothetical protein
VITNSFFFRVGGVFQLISDFIKQAKAGEAVFITDVRNAFTKLDKKQTMSCILELVDSSIRVFELNIPALDDLDDEQTEFAKSYVSAEIYNILSALGGKKMTIYIEKSSKRLVALAKELDKIFCINMDRSKRKRYGKCVNVIDRMLGAIVDPDAKFAFVIENASDMGDVCDTEPAGKGDIDIFKKVTQNIKGKVICGLDIGGTDIKGAMVVDGNLCCLKEYDWFPESFTLAEQLNDPICMLVRLMRVQVSLNAYDGLNAEEKMFVQQELTKAMHKDAAYDEIAKVVKSAEQMLKGKLVEVDAVGLCFPDVVVKDKVVGGEATKTRGMRANPQINYEKEFFKITELDKQLLKICKKGGVVKDTNDGPMAAFTAAVEIATSDAADTVANGVFAHTLGTELGTGWVDGCGNIPEIPLECYNFIIDLGDFVAKEYPADDARSINNVNTSLAGTLQKYASQSGVSRLGLKMFKEARPELYQGLFDEGLVEERGDMIVVPTKPNDMRKALLEHMMALTEDDDVAREIFKQVGVFLAITWFETQRIIKPTSEARTLFGRLVKRPICFEMMKEGVSTRLDNPQMDVADASMANTSLMKQLEADPEFTVAQFAQAIGAVYYGNMGLLTK